MTFYAEEIDICPAFGWEGGPSADVLIRRLRSGRTKRNRRTAVAPHTFTLPFQNVADDAYLEKVKSAYLAMGGPADTFLAKDFGDYRHGFVSDGYAPMVFATGDGVTLEFQLTKTYRFGSASYVRDITKPVSTGLVIYVAGVPVLASISTLTGIVSFSVAPANGAEISWVGEYRVPVYFEDFILPSTIDNRIRHGRKYATNGSCTLVEDLGV